MSGTAREDREARGYGRQDGNASRDPSRSRLSFSASRPRRDASIIEPENVRPPDDDDDDLPTSLTQPEDESRQFLRLNMIISKPILEGAFPGEAYKVKFAPMSPTSAPLVITQSEFMRRMKEQQAVGGGGFQMFGDMPDSYDVTVNANHPLATTLLNETDDAKRAALAKQAANLARLSQGLLEGEELTAFIQDGFAQLQGA